MNEILEFAGVMVLAVAVAFAGLFLFVYALSCVNKIVKWNRRRRQASLSVYGPPLPPFWFKVRRASRFLGLALKRLFRWISVKSVAFAKWSWAKLRKLGPLATRFYRATKRISGKFGFLGRWLKILIISAVVLAGIFTAFHWLDLGYYLTGPIDVDFGAGWRDAGWLYFVPIAVIFFFLLGIIKIATGYPRFRMPNIRWGFGSSVTTQPWYERSPWPFLIILAGVVLFYFAISQFLPNFWAEWSSKPGFWWLQALLIFGAVASSMKGAANSVGTIAFLVAFLAVMGTSCSSCSTVVVRKYELQAPERERQAAVVRAERERVLAEKRAELGRRETARQVELERQNAERRAEVGRRREITHGYRTNVVITTPNAWTLLTLETDRKITGRRVLILRPGHLMVKVNGKVLEDRRTRLPRIFSPDETIPLGYNTIRTIEFKGDVTQRLEVITGG